MCDLSYFMYQMWYTIIMLVRTEQQLKARYGQHFRNVVNNKHGTFLVKHFNSADHHPNHLSIQIIDYCVPDR